MPCEGTLPLAFSAAELSTHQPIAVPAGLSYELLNAKPENVQREAEIVAQSGRRGSVTISTNMAGRGTDILLGGNPEYMARVSPLEIIASDLYLPWQH